MKHQFVNFKNNKKKGFSIAEILIYITILVFMLTVVINILFTILKSQRSFNASKSVESSALVSMERITREIREAQSINTSSSTLAVHPGLLTLESTDTNGNPRTVKFSLVNNKLNLEENGIGQGALTRLDSKVTRLVFTSIVSTSSRAVRTEITIESGTSTNYRSGKFYSTTILRGSL